MDTILWDKESDNYTRRAMDALKDEIYQSKSYQDKIKKFAKTLLNYSNPPNYVLDIGCGYGATVKTLLSIFPESKFEGIDPGNFSIRTCKENISSRNANFQLAYSHELPFENESFDLIIFNMVMQWIPRKYLIKTIAEVDRVLKPGGIISLYEFSVFKPVTSVSKHNNDVWIFKQDYQSNLTSFPWFKNLYSEILNEKEIENRREIFSIIKKYPIEEAYLKVQL